MHPKLFGIINSYSVFLVIGFLVGLILFELYMRKKVKVETNRLFYVEMTLVFSMAFGVVGAYLFQNLYNFIESPSTYRWSWSLTFFGGLVSGIAFFLVVYALWTRRGYPGGLRQILHIAPGAIALSHAFGRVGCFMAGCCYGLPTDAWYGIQFQTTDVKVIPTNLFEAIFLFILAAVLIFLCYKRDCEYGPAFYGFFYGLFRFLIEFLRNDHRGAFIPGLSPSQFWAILFMVFGVGYFIFMFLLRKREREGNALKGA